MSQKGFIATESPLEFYNAQAVLDLPFPFVYDDEDSTLFDFPSYVSSFLFIYDERRGRLIKSFTTQMTRNSNTIVMNCSESDMTFEDNGKYYYEMGYIFTGGYEIVLRYGVMEII